MATAITPLANTTLSTGATTITLSSISGLYRDLYIVLTGTSGAQFYPQMQFNNDTSSSYYLVAAGSASATNSGTGLYVGYYGSGWVTNYVSSSIIHIMDYSATDKHKTVLMRDGVTDATDMIAGRWAATSAITSIKFYGGTFAAGTTIALYGVSA